MRQIISGLLAVCVILAVTGCGVSQVPAPQTGIAGDIVTDRAAVTPEDSSDAVIQASPPEPSQSLGVLFFSDTQANPETGDYSGVRDLLAGALSLDNRADICIFGGDTVNDGSLDTEWDDFRQAVYPLTDKLITAAIPGNHDDTALLAEQFDYPAKASAGHGEGYFYSLRMGPVFFIMLDSNIMGAANQTDIDRLQSELQSGDARQAVWRVAVMHHPMWPVADIPKDIQRAETMREYFLPILEEYGVELILCGHQHVYARTLPMSGEAVCSGGNGIAQIMAASGGKESYILGDREYIAADAPAPNYLYLFADDRRLTVTVYNGEHSVIDEITMQK